MVSRLLPALLAEVVTATWAIFFRRGDRNANWAAVELFTVEFFDSFLVISFIGEFYETKTAGAVGVAIGNDASARNFADLLEEVL